MNNNAHDILMLAIAKHGEKLATSTAYCNVYLAGYMADYPVEKQLLTSLRQQGLAEALIAHSRKETTQSELYIFMETLKRTTLYEQAELAWGVDAWAAALSIPEVVRKHIRTSCFSLSASLNADLKLTSGIVTGHSATRELPIRGKAQVKRGKSVLPLSTLAFFTLMTSQLADGYTSPDFAQPRVTTQQSLTSKTAPLSAPVKNTKSTKIVTKQFKIEKPLSSAIKPTEKAALVKRNKTRAAPPTLEPLALNLDLSDSPSKTKKNRRLQAQVEAFLKHKTTH